MSAPDSAQLRLSGYLPTATYGEVHNAFLGLMRFPLQVRVGLLLTMCLGASSCQSRKGHSMQVGTTPSANKTFAPHPGRIVQHYKWNGKDESVSASEVPDSVKFIYYDASGQQTADTSAAQYRVPVVEIDIVTLDRDGKSDDPEHAVHLFMTEYGPGHRELRHSTSTAPGHP